MGGRFGEEIYPTASGRVPKYIRTGRVAARANMVRASRTAASRLSTLAVNGRFGFLPPAAQGRLLPFRSKK
jgi:hypothetical protein